MHWSGQDLTELAVGGIVISLIAFFTGVPEEIAIVVFVCVGVFYFSWKWGGRNRMP